MRPLALFLKISSSGFQKTRRRLGSGFLPRSVPIRPEAQGIVRRLRALFAARSSGLAGVSVPLGDLRIPDLNEAVGRLRACLATLLLSLGEHARCLLFALAEEGKLHDPEILKGQVARMLRNSSRFDFVEILSSSGSVPAIWAKASSRCASCSRCGATPNCKETSDINPYSFFRKFSRIIFPC